MADEASLDAAAWRSPIAELARRVSAPSAMAFAQSLSDQFKALDAFVPKPLVPPGLDDLLAKMDRDSTLLAGVTEALACPVAVTASVTGMMDRFATPALGELASLARVRDCDPAIAPSIIANSPEVRTARAAIQLVEWLDEYEARAEVAAAAQRDRDRRGEAREASMLRLTRIGVALAAISVLVAVVLGVLAVT